MPPTYEELVEIVKLQQNQIVELQKVVQQQDKQIKKQDKENKKLHNQLRKFLNENTPSGAMPPYLKDELESAFPPENANTEKSEEGKQRSTIGINDQNLTRRKITRQEKISADCNSS